MSDADIESQLDFVKSCYTPAMQELLSTNNRDKPSDTLFAALDSGQVKRKSIRGAGVALGSQALRFVLQMGTTMILARLLSPEDFGLQAMVLATTALLGLFVGPALRVATVQRDVITHEQNLSAVLDQCWAGICTDGVGGGPGSGFRRILS